MNKIINNHEAVKIVSRVGSLLIRGVLPTLFTEKRYTLLFIRRFSLLPLHLNNDDAAHTARPAPASSVRNGFSNSFQKITEVATFGLTGKLL
jgi:hypothetical protein